MILFTALLDFKRLIKNESICYFRFKNPWKDIYGRHLIWDCTYSIVMCHLLRKIDVRLEEGWLFDCIHFEELSNFWRLKERKSTPVGVYLLKVSNWNTRTKCEICLKLTINTPERRQWRRSGVFIVNFEHISHLVRVFLLLTLSR